MLCACIRCARSGVHGVRRRARIRPDQKPVSSPPRAREEASEEAFLQKKGMAEVARLVAHRAAAAAPAAKEESPKRALADTKKAAAIVQQARTRGQAHRGRKAGGGGDSNGRISVGPRRACAGLEAQMHEERSSFMCVLFSFASSSSNL